MIIFVFIIFIFEIALVSESFYVMIFFEVINMKEPFTYRLAKIMKQRNITQADLSRLCQPYARRMGVKMSSQYISKYINGVSAPSPESLTVLAEALGVSELWLLGYETADALTTEELSLLEAWRRCTPKERKTIASILEDYGFKLEEKSTLSSEYA